MVTFTPVRVALHQDWVAALVGFLLQFISVPFNWKSSVSSGCRRSISSLQLTLEPARQQLQNLTNVLSQELLYVTGPSSPQLCHYSPCNCLPAKPSAKCSTEPQARSKDRASGSTHCPPQGLISGYLVSSPDYYRSLLPKDPKTAEVLLFLRSFGTALSPSMQNSPNVFWGKPECT